MMKPPFPPVPFTTSEAKLLGRDSKALTRAERDRAIVRMFTGAYVRADVEITTAVRARAARLVMNPHSVLCDRTAAWLLGIDVMRYAELDVPPPLESYVLRGHDPTDRRECHGGTRDLLPEDWQEVHGVRVTTPARTAVDLACKLPRREALAALDAFARAYGVTVLQLQSLLPRYYRRRGVIQAVSWSR